MYTTLTWIKWSYNIVQLTDRIPPPPLSASWNGSERSALLTLMPCLLFWTRTPTIPSSSSWANFASFIWTAARIEQLGWVSMTSLTEDKEEGEGIANYVFANSIQSILVTPNLSHEHNAWFEITQRANTFQHCRDKWPHASYISSF